MVVMADQALRMGIHLRSATGSGSGGRWWHELCPAVLAAEEVGDAIANLNVRIGFDGFPAHRIPLGGRIVSPGESSRHAGQVW